MCIEQRIAKLEKKTQRLRMICAVQLGAIAFACVCAALTNRVQAQSTSSILRVRGLVIEDDQGRARVILGAPAPEVSGRKRQNSETESMVFLDEAGFDRLTLGEAANPQSQGKVLHRIAPFFGVTIHDSSGNERGGYGWLANRRAVLTLDRPGLDAWAAVVDDKTGFAGMRVEYAPEIAKDKTGIEIGTQADRAVIRLMDTKERNRAVLTLAGGNAPSFQVFDEEGHAGADLLKQEPQ